MEHGSGLAPAMPDTDGRALTIEFLSHRLVTARRRLDMSQAELARRLGVDQSTVSRMERGDMQGPPWTLVLRACLHLGIEPHALMVDEPETFRRDLEDSRVRYKTCRPISVARARVAMHFLYLGGAEGRLPEVLRHCLGDVMRVRPSVVGLSLLLFRGYDRRPTHSHAQWRRGEIAFAEHMEGESLTAPVRWLKGKWEQGETVVRDARPEVPAWKPHLAIDQPIDQGMVGFDFADDEDPERDGTMWWVGMMAETFSIGLRMVPPRRQRGYSAEMREIAARLTAIEDHLAGGGNGRGPTPSPNGPSGA